MILSVPAVNLSDWTHVAWTYDQASGMGRLYLNGVVQASNDGTDGQGLLWNSSNRSLWVGEGVGSGGVDEIRISDTALGENEFLNAPEPASLTMLSIAGFLMYGRLPR